MLKYLMPIILLNVRRAQGCVKPFEKENSTFFVFAAFSSICLFCPLVIILHKSKAGAGAGAVRIAAAAIAYIAVSA